MRYFSRGWTDGSYDDELVEQVKRDYLQRLDVLRPEMPPSVLALATETTLHDALIDRLTWHSRTRRLDIVLIGPTPGGEPAKVALSFRGVQMRDENVHLLGERVRDRRTRVLYDEVDRADDGIWVHRMLLCPFGESRVWFSELEISITSHPDSWWEFRGWDPFSVEDGEDEDENPAGTSERGT
jgi:hypothetical protein